MEQPYRPVYLEVATDLLAADVPMDAPSSPPAALRPAPARSRTPPPASPPPSGR